MLFLDIASGRPGMLVPVLSSSNTNLPYVQQMDEFLQVKEIVPFLEYENYPTIPSAAERVVLVGDKGLIAFRSFDNNVVCGDVGEVLTYIEDNRDMISQDPLLKSQLHRIESAELNPSYDAWREVASRIFGDETQRKFWVDSELQLFQKQRRIWAEIDPLETDDPSSHEGMQSPLSEYGPEYLIRWLSARGNFGAKNWTKVWHYTNERLPFDDRILQVALSWIFYLGDEDQDLSQSKSILYALLERGDTFGAELPDLSSFLSDRLVSDPSLIFEFLRPKRLFAQLFKFLARNADIGDLITIVKFCSAELPKVAYIFDAMVSSLELVIAQTANTEWRNPATVKREFEQVQIHDAYELYSRLKALPRPSQ